MDRLDYLKRDSFFTGVTEGVIGSDRIIKMLNVLNDQLVVEEKGIYSIEKFLIARRLMYWQVYLHRTVVASEQVLVMLLKRAQVLSSRGMELFATPALSYFLKEDSQISLEHFAHLDDIDILASAKVWCNNSDRVLSILANGLVNRKLLSVELDNRSFSAERVAEIRAHVADKLSLSREETEYLVVSDSISNYAYSNMDDRITIMDKHGKTRDIAEASDILNISVLSLNVRKYFLCYPRFVKEKYQTNL
jgi:HD superfamily phosphohydrolase